MDVANVFKKIRWKYRLTIIFIGFSFFFLWFTGVSPKGIVWAVYWPGIFMLQLIILTTPWRAVPLGQIFRMFLLGMGLIPLLTYIIQALFYMLVNLEPIRGFLTSDSLLGNYDLMALVVAPITEEVLKVSPAVVLLGWGRYASWRRILGPLDAAILAGASGAGFSFIENLLRVASNNWAALGPDRVEPVASLHIGSFYLFPEMVESQYYGVPIVWFGHAEMTACVGLALGIGLFLRKQFKAWWLLPGITLLWAMWDHFLINYMRPEPSQTWAKILPALDLYGRLLPYLFLAGILLSIVLAVRTQRWYKSIDKTSLLDSSFSRFFKSLLKNPWLFPKKLYILLKFIRLRRLAAYGLKDFSFAEPKQAINWAAWLSVIREQMQVEYKRLVE